MRPAGRHTRVGDARPARGGRCSSLPRAPAPPMGARVASPAVKLAARCGDSPRFARAVAPAAAPRGWRSASGAGKGRGRDRTVMQKVLG
eukprot:scaffold2200_cov413-Prasinococcus_capsulatus_cf.AAC.42